MKTQSTQEFGAVYPVYSDGRFTIIRRVIGHAYARSGNAHNPTPRHSWDVYDSGKLVGVCGSRKQANLLRDECRSEETR